jgi:hypothetical protein
MPDQSVSVPTDPVVKYHPQIQASLVPGRSHHSLLRSAVGYAQIAYSADSHSRSDYKGAKSSSCHHETRQDAVAYPHHSATRLDLRRCLIEAALRCIMSYQLPNAVESHPSCFLYLDWLLSSEGI